MIIDNVEHHGPLLKKSLSFLAGYAAGISDEKPYIWKSSVLCPYKGKNIVIRGGQVKEKFDSIEIFISGLSLKGRIIINYKFFNTDYEDILRSLFIIKHYLDNILEGKEIGIIEISIGN